MKYSLQEAISELRNSKVLKENYSELAEAIDLSIIDLDQLEDIAIDSNVSYQGQQWRISNVTIHNGNYLFELSPLSGEADENSYSVTAKAFAKGAAVTENSELNDICMKIAQGNDAEEEAKQRSQSDLMAKQRAERQQSRAEYQATVKKRKEEAGKQAGEADGKTKKRTLYNYFKDILAGRRAELHAAKLKREAEQYDPQSYVDAYDEARLKWRYQNQTTNNYGSNDDAVNWLSNHWVKIYAVGPEEMINQFQNEFDIQDDDYIKVRPGGLALGLVMQCDIPYDDPSDPAPGFLTNMYHTDVLGKEFNNGFSERRKNLFKTTSYIVYLLRTYPSLFWVGKKK